ncbi:ATP synthase F0 subunit B [bacterium]|nr:ATP synthase F0 subunit B [bacterium]
MSVGHEAAAWSVKEWYTLAHVTVIVGIVYFFGKTAIKGALESRRSGIKQKLIETKEQLSALQVEIQQAREKIKNIDDEKQALISKVEHEGRKLSEKLISEAEKTAERILADAKLAAKSEVTSYQNKLRQDIVEASLAKTMESLNADKKSGGDLTKKLHSQLVDKFVREASRVFHV